MSLLYFVSLLISSANPLRRLKRFNSRLENQFGRYNVAHGATGLQRIKRIAGILAQRRRLGIKNKAALALINHVDLCDLVKMLAAIRQLHLNGFTTIHVLQEKKVCIAVTRDDAVPVLPW